MTDSFSDINRKNTQVPGRLVPVVILLILILVFPVLSVSADDISQESRIKAALVNYIARFVEWPESAYTVDRESFELCVLGGNDNLSAFDPFVGELIHDRPLAVEKIDTPEEIPAGCRVLYITETENGKIIHALEKAEDRPVLTVGARPEFTEMGGIVGLVTVDGRIRFTVNAVSARQAGLTVSSNLMKLAYSTQGEVK